MPNGVRERVRDAVRNEIADVAFDMFAECGFDAVTVDEVAEAAGISRATFFRYFGSKEDAAIAALELAGPDFGATMRLIPVVPGESLWDVLRGSLDASVEVVAARPMRLRSRMRLILSTPALRSRLSEKRLEQRRELADALNERIDDSWTALVLAGAALAALDVAWSEWVFDEGASRPFGSVLDASFAALGAAR